MHNHEFENLMDKLKINKIAEPFEPTSFSSDTTELFSKSILASEISAYSHKRFRDKAIMLLTTVLSGLLLYPGAVIYSLLSEINLGLCITIVLLVHIILLVASSFLSFITTESPNDIGMDYVIHKMWYVDTPFESFIEKKHISNEISQLIELIEIEPHLRYLECSVPTSIGSTLDCICQKTLNNNFTDTEMPGFFLCTVSSHSNPSHTHLVVVDLKYTEQYLLNIQ